MGAKQLKARHSTPSSSSKWVALKARIKRLNRPRTTSFGTLPNSDERGDLINQAVSCSEDHHLSRAGKEANNGSDGIMGEEVISMIRKSVIGDRCIIPTPFGTRELVYADYTASGRALSFIEEYMVNLVSPLYANTHTEASLTGAQTTLLREEARDIIHDAVNAPKEVYAVIFTGTGSTGAIDKLVRVLGFSIPEYADKRWNLKSRIPATERPVVFISHFEHHSNELIWRESIARVVVINEDGNGQPDLDHLEQELCRYKKQKVPLVGSFSAGSNVTGIKTDTSAIARLLHKHGAYAFFDFAGVGAYVDIDMYGDGDLGSMDAAFMSPHKFIGGPGAAGILVARRKLFRGALGIDMAKPSVPGGGTVSFVSQYSHAYAQDAETREDAGTPGIPQCIRAGLVFQTKNMVGCDVIEKLESNHTLLALAAWKKHPCIAILGSDRKACNDPEMRVPIVSFNILSPIKALSEKKQIPRFCRSPAANPKARQVLSSGCARMAPKVFESIIAAENLTLPLHPSFVIALLNDVYGIQGRGGCSCAGPYGHVLFGIGGEAGKPTSKRLLTLAINGHEAFRPGWARVNLNYFISNHEAGFIVEAVKQIASHGWKLLPLYTHDLESGQYIHISSLGEEKKKCPFSMHDIKLLYQDTGEAKFHYTVPRCLTGERNQSDYEATLNKAMKLYQQAEQEVSTAQDFTSALPGGVETGDIWWLRASEAAKELDRRRSRRSHSTGTSIRIHRGQ